MIENPKPPITPQTKVGELLDAYPDLEPVLIDIAPPFKKLRNPILRRTVARVTSLAQAARVGGVPVTDMIQRLRRTAGQPDFVPDQSTSPTDTTSASAPEWMDPEKIVDTLDARPMIDKGEQPIGRVMHALTKLEPGRILEVITPFEPAPLIDKAASRGYRTWTTPKAPGEYRTYFTASREV